MAGVERMHKMDESRTRRRGEAREFWSEAVRLWVESGLTDPDAIPFCSTSIHAHSPDRLIAAHDGVGYNQDRAGRSQAHEPFASSCPTCDGLVRYEAGVEHHRRRRSMASIFSRRTSVAPLIRENSNSIWCFPRCSEFWRGERQGVITASSQWHESARLAAKESPTGGVIAARDVDASPNGVGRYGRQSALAGTGRQQKPRNGG